MQGGGAAACTPLRGWRRLKTTGTAHVPPPPSSWGPPNPPPSFCIPAHNCPASQRAPPGAPTLRARISPPPSPPSPLRAPRCTPPPPHRRSPALEGGRMAAARVGALVAKARAAVEPAVSMASKEAVKQYEQVMAANQQYVVKDPAAANKLLRQYVFTQLARCARAGGRGRRRRCRCRVLLPSRGRGGSGSGVSAQAQLQRGRWRCSTGTRRRALTAAATPSCPRAGSPLAWRTPRRSGAC